MRGGHLGEFEELVLLAVHGLADAAYGVAVRQLLETETGRSVSIGPVYTALERLQQKRLVRSQVVAGTAVRGGRRRRVFALTAAGLEALAELQAIRARLYAQANLRPAKGRT